MRSKCIATKVQTSQIRPLSLNKASHGSIVKLVIIKQQTVKLVPTAFGKPFSCISAQTVVTQVQVLYDGYTKPFYCICSQLVARQAQREQARPRLSGKVSSYSAKTT